MEAKDLFAKRLKQARQKAGLSMDALSAKTGKEVSKQTISKYEAGKTMAGSAILIKLSQALSVPVDYFFRPYTFNISEVEISFRKKAYVKAKDQTLLKIKIQDKVERFIEIETILGSKCSKIEVNVPTQISLPIQMITLAKEVRRTWGIGISPIPSVKNLLMAHNIKVFEIDGPEGFDGISGLANDNIPLIVINSSIQNVERRRFTQMHELAHLLTNASFDEGLSHHDKEKLCDAFASEILLPSEVVEHEFGSKSKISVQELKKIQKVYGISIDAIAYSFKRLGIFNENRHRSFCIKKNMDPKFKAWVETSRYIEPLSTKDYDDEFYEGLVYSAVSQELISISKAAQLLNTSVTEVESKSYAF
ncbi:MAG: XRE family transcriptional regulator [Muribaculaceae bacterium]|nr:XRE family transcriptional regulator [Muribaculaceae bacterium]